METGHRFHFLSNQFLLIEHFRLHLSYFLQHSRFRFKVYHSFCADVLNLCTHPSTTQRQALVLRKKWKTLRIFVRPTSGSFHQRPFTLKIVKKTIHLIFCDEFPVLRRDLLLKTYDLLLQGVDLTHVVHVRSIVPFRGLRKNSIFFFRLSCFFLCLCLCLCQ